MNDDDNLLKRIALSPEYEIELEIQAEAAGMSVKDHARMLLKQALEEIKESNGPPPKTHH